MLSDPEEFHHQLMAETELIIGYARSPIVAGNARNACSARAAGFRLSDTIAVDVPANPLGSCTSWVTAPTTRCCSAASVRTGWIREFAPPLQELVVGSSVFESAVGFASRSDGSGTVGVLAPASAEQLGVKGVTLLAMRPDGYVGLRSNGEQLAALERYRDLVLETTGALS